MISVECPSWTSHERVDCLFVLGRTATKLQYVVVLLCFSCYVYFHFVRGCALIQLPRGCAAKAHGGELE